MAYKLIAFSAEFLIKGEHIYIRTKPKHYNSFIEAMREFESELFNTYDEACLESIDIILW